MANPAEVVHMQKMQAAKRSLEDADGKKIKEDKIQEWALLEIAEKLEGIRYQVAQVLAEMARARGRH
jgi:hypothetical protein